MMLLVLSKTADCGGAVTQQYPHLSPTWQVSTLVFKLHILSENTIYSKQMLALVREQRRVSRALVGHDASVFLNVCKRNHKVLQLF